MLFANITSPSIGSRDRCVWDRAPDTGMHTIVWPSEVHTRSGFQRHFGVSWLTECGDRRGAQRPQKAQLPKGYFCSRSANIDHGGVHFDQFPSAVRAMAARCKLSQLPRGGSDRGAKAGVLLGVGGVL